MALSPAIETERLTNLIRGFGWTMIKQEIQNDKLVVTIEKKIDTKPTGMPT